MSQSWTAQDGGDSHDRVERDLFGEATEGRLQECLSLLQDPDCREILEATTGGALSTKEISESCSIPTSTTYRKLDQLAEAGLVTERTRIRRSGSHASEYVCSVETVHVGIRNTGGFEFRIE